MKSKRNIPSIAIIIIFILVAILAARKSLDIFDYIEKHNTGHEMTSHSETQLSDPPMSFSPLPWKNYQVIVEDNLFRPLGWEKEVIEKDKPRRKSFVEIPPVAVPQERPKPDPSTGSGHAYNLTLTGIAQNGSEWVAILEDPTRNEGHFLHLGEKFKNSLISEISPEHIILAQGNVQAQLFVLSYADATDVASELNKAFSSSARSTFDTTGSTRGGSNSFSRRMLQQQPQSTTSEGGVLGLPELVAVADERTNSVIVTTTAQQMESIGKLIEQLDLDIADYAEDTRVFGLEYADASNVASMLNSLFSTQLFEQQRGRATRADSQTGAMGTAAQSTEDASGLTGNVKIVADQDTNVLLITTFVKNFPAIEKIIKELDVLLPQVLIEAQIIEVTLDDESTFGVEWMWEKEKTTVLGKDYSQTISPDFSLC